MAYTINPKQEITLDSGTYFFSTAKGENGSISYGQEGNREKENIDEEGKSITFYADSDVSNIGATVITCSKDEDSDGL